MKEVIKSLTKIATGTTMVFTAHSYYLTIKDNGEKAKYLQIAEDARTRATAAEERAQQLELENIQNESKANELNSLQNEMVTTRESIERNRDLFNKATTKEEFEKCAQNLSDDLDKSSSLVERCVNIVKRKFTDDGEGLFDKITKFYIEYNNFIDGLTIHQLGSLFNLLAAIFISLCIISVIIIIYSDKLLKYFQIEEKYPRLAKLIILRRKLQNIYLLINLLLIIITLAIVIYINITALTT